MEKSTEQPHYPAELARITGLSEQATYTVLTTIESAGFATAQKEDLGFCRKRAPRHNYDLTQNILDVIRMTPLPTIQST
jgi:hypothetical protein